VLVSPKNIQRFYLIFLLHYQTRIISTSFSEFWLVHRNFFITQKQEGKIFDESSVSSF